MEYQLTQCVWEITLACCFSCRYCGSRAGHVRDNELSTEECLRIAGELQELGCRRVSMIGGEVFMRKDWNVLVGRLTELGIAVNVITNGFLFSDEILQELKRLHVESVAVSVDGPREVHDRYRQQGSYDRAFAAIRALAGAGIPVSVISTLNADNSTRLEELYRDLLEVPIFAWQLQACSPMGNAGNGGVDFRFDPGAVIGFVESHMRQAPFCLGVADNIGYFAPGEGSIRGNMSGRAYFRGCSAGLSVIGIDSIGNVRGCESMYDDCFIEGNLRNQSLRDIWDNPDAFAYNRKFTPDRLTGRCSTCEMGPFCGGGCRSYNYFVHGRIYESPFCARTGAETYEGTGARTDERTGEETDEEPEKHGIFTKN